MKQQTLMDVEYGIMLERQLWVFEDEVYPVLCTAPLKEVVYINQQTSINIFISHRKMLSLPQPQLPAGLVLGVERS